MSRKQRTSAAEAFKAVADEYDVDLVGVIHSRDGVDTVSTVLHRCAVPPSEAERGAKGALATLKSAIADLQMFHDHIEQSEKH